MPDVKWIRIITPKDEGTITTVPWYASGIMSEKMGVRGTVHDKQVLFSGTTIRYTEETQPDGTVLYRWYIRFTQRPQGAGPFTLKVESTSDPSVDATHRIKFDERTTQKRPHNIFIRSHQDEDDITGEAMAFVAWGEMQDHTVTSVTMNTIGSMVNEDWENMTWTAMFPTLGPGTYTLLAVDSANHSDAVENLVVNGSTQAVK